MKLNGYLHINEELLCWLEKYGKDNNKNTSFLLDSLIEKFLYAEGYLGIEV